MSKPLNSYPWYPADWRGSETRLAMTMEERGLYRELLDHCWIDGSLPSDSRMLISISGCTEKEWKRSSVAVLQQFQLRDGRLYHRKVDIRRQELLDWHAQKAEAGKRSAEAKRLRSANGKSTDVATSVPTENQRTLQRAFQPSSSSSSSSSSSLASGLRRSGGSSPPPHAQAAYDWLRQALIDFVGDECTWPAPDPKILTQILDYTGSSEDDLTKIYEFLRAKMATKRRPKSSWAWFLTVIRDEMQIVSAKGVIDYATPTD